MKLIEIKKLYDTGNYVCYQYLPAIEIWTKLETVNWSSNYIHRLIHKNHEFIADYVITYPDTIVDVKFLTDVDFHPNKTTDDFFRTYNPEMFDYRLSLEPKSESEEFYGATEKDVEIVKDALKLNDKNFESHCDDIFGKDSKIKPILSITANDGTIHEFEKPEFDCEFIAIQDNYIYGNITIGGITFVVKWSDEGGVVSSGGATRAYNLVPIEKHWYDSSENFPRIVYNTGGFSGIIEVTHKIDNILYYHGGHTKIWDIRDLTKTEVDSIYYEGKE